MMPHMPCSTWNGATVASDIDPRPAREDPRAGDPSGSDGDPPESISIAPESTPPGGQPFTIMPAASGAMAHHGHQRHGHPPPPSFPDQYDSTRATTRSRDTSDEARAPGTHVKGISTVDITHVTSCTRRTEHGALVTDEGVSTGPLPWHSHRLRARQLPPAPSPHPRPMMFHGCGALPTCLDPQPHIDAHRVWMHQRPVTLHRRVTPPSEVPTDHRRPLR